MTSTKPVEKQENIFLNLLFNIVIPALILSKLSGEAQLGPTLSLLVGLAFPFCYGAYDLLVNHRRNFVSVLGFVSIALSGGFGLLKVDGLWFAVKEAAIPSIIGIFLVASLKTKNPLVKAMFYNERVIDVHLVNAALEQQQKTAEFNRLLASTTFLLAASFFVSAVLNFGLAMYIIKSPAGTPEFNQELGTMTALSYPVIVLPCLVITGLTLWRLLSGIRGLTGLHLDHIFKGKTPSQNVVK